MNSAYIENDFDKVIRLAEEIKEIDKDVKIVYKLLAEIYEGQSPQDIPRLLENRAEEARLDKDNVGAWLQCARCAVKMKKWQEAIRFYNRAKKKLEGVDWKFTLKIKIEKFQIYIEDKNYAMIIKSIDLILPTIGKSLDENSQDKDR